MTLEPLSAEQTDAFRFPNSNEILTRTEPQAAEPAVRSRKGIARRVSARRAGARSQIPVVIVDQSAVLRLGLSHFLAGSRFRTMASCPRLSEIAENKLAGRPCVVLIGLNNDPATILSQVSTLKQAHEKMLVVGLAERFSSEELLAAIDAGIDGYLLKHEISSEAVVAAMEMILLGGTVVPRAFTRRLALHDTPFPSRHDRPAGFCASAEAGVPTAIEIETKPNDLRHLSPREQAVLMHLTAGRSNKEIARDLAIAEPTVKVHVKGLLRKLGVNNRTQAAMWATARLPSKLTANAHPN